MLTLYSRSKTSLLLKPLTVVHAVSLMTDAHVKDKVAFLLSKTKPSYKNNSFMEWLDNNNLFNQEWDILTSQPLTPTTLTVLV